MDGLFAGGLGRARRRLSAGKRLQAIKAMLPDRSDFMARVCLRPHHLCFPRVKGRSGENLLLIKNISPEILQLTLSSAPVDFRSVQERADAESGRWGDAGMHIEANDAGEGLPLPQAGSTGDELLKMGLLYSTGQGGAPLDYVSAHMLFNLAAMRGSEEAKHYRRELSLEMDRDSVAEAQRAARCWLAAS